MAFSRTHPPTSAAPTSSPSADHGTRVLLGRQPILDRARRVVGYGIVVGAADETGHDATQTAEMGIHGILAAGVDRLARDRRAFVEAPPSILQGDLIRRLPASQAVVAISARRGRDPETVDACRRLVGDGFTLALSHYSADTDAGDLLPLVDFVSSDPAGGDEAAAACLKAGQAGGRTRATIAVGVDRADAFTRAVAAGFTHAQGYSFVENVGGEARPMPRGQVGALRLLYALTLPHLSLGDVEDLFKRDASLCYRLLCAVNSAAFAQTREITSIRQALLLIGLDTIRRWATLWIVADLGAGAHGELVTMASFRGRFCELIATRRYGPAAGGEGFLLGMCSCLDAILQRPMSTIVAELPLSTDVTAALLGRDGPTRQLLDCVVAHERGDFSTSLPLADTLGVERRWLAPAYREALAWVLDPGVGLPGSTSARH